MVHWSELELWVSSVRFASVPICLTVGMVISINILYSHCSFHEFVLVLKILENYHGVRLVSERSSELPGVFPPYYNDKCNNSSTKQLQRLVPPSKTKYVRCWYLSYHHFTCHSELWRTRWVFQNDSGLLYTIKCDCCTRCCLEQTNTSRAN
jgi:hypothetical protein